MTNRNFEEDYIYFLRASRELFCYNCHNQIVDGHYFCLILNKMEELNHCMLCSLRIWGDFCSPLKYFEKQGRQKGIISVDELDSELLNLHRLAAKGEMEKVRDICSRSPELINVANYWGRTALFSAVQGNSPQTFELLLSGGALPNLKDAFGKTVIHYAIRQNSTEEVRILIKAGADVTLADKGMNSPLHAASFKSRPEIAEMLIRNGADLKRLDKYGNTPLDLAKKRGSGEMIKLIEGYTAYNFNQDRNGRF